MIIGNMIGMNIAAISKLLTKIDPPFDVEGAPPCIASEAVYQFSEIDI